MKEKNINQKLISVGDIVLLVAIIALCIALIFVFGLNKKTGMSAVISVDGQDVKTLSMDKDAEYRVDTASGYNMVVIKDGKLNVSEADCPDKICVNHKPVDSVGETIICLPHKVVVEVVE